jgi:hypothetical protein
MARLTQALEFTRREVESALNLYFEPLWRISRAVQKFRERSDLTDLKGPRFDEPERLPIASKKPRRTSVSEDWSAWLSVQKAELFDSQVRQLEVVYGMFSVSLSEAMELRNTGETARARQAVGLIPPLATRLVDSLYALLRAMLSHAEKRGIVPSVVPVDESNFLGKRSKRVARLSSLLSSVLLTDRSLFFHKISTLQEMIGDLVIDIRMAARALSSLSSMRPDTEWLEIKSAHYDLNTCLRETIIILKSFLVAMPDEQIDVFEGEINRVRRGQMEDEPGHQYEHGRWTPLTSEDIVYAKKAS